MRKIIRSILAYLGLSYDAIVDYECEIAWMEYHLGELIELDADLVSDVVVALMTAAHHPNLAAKINMLTWEYVTGCADAEGYLAALTAAIYT